MFNIYRLYLGMYLVYGRIVNIVPVVYEIDMYEQFGWGENLRLCLIAEFNRH